MVAIPKKVSNRLSSEIPKYKRVINKAKSKDVNESDTVTIITDMLADVFGYDKYCEITREHSIRGTFCDLAVEYDGQIHFLIEAKAIGIKLNTNHLRQAVGYAANEGIHWVILTNGDEWQIYKLKDQLPISYENVFSFKLTEINLRKEDDKEKLFLLCKEGISKSAIEKFHGHLQSINPFTIGAVLLSDPILSAIRRELRKLSPGIKVTTEEIAKILTQDTLKRDVVDSEETTEASKRIKKTQKKKKVA